MDHRKILDRFLGKYQSNLDGIKIQVNKRLIVCVLTYGLKSTMSNIFTNPLSLKF